MTKVPFADAFYMGTMKTTSDQGLPGLSGVLTIQIWEIEACKSLIGGDV